MKVLIVYAHPEPQSLNGELKNMAVNELEKEGHEVIISDLYKMNFNPVASKKDFKYMSNNDFFSYSEEQKHAYEYDLLSEDILAEVKKLLWADLVIFQFPLWWASVPAILKGWFDKVLLFGCIYGGEYGKFEKARLKGKIAIISTTTGASEESYKSTGVYGDIEKKILYPINHGILEYTGLTTLKPFIAYQVNQNNESRKEHLNRWRSQLKNIEKLL